MHPVLFYVIATAALSISASVAMYYINENYSRQNVYDDDQIIKPVSDSNSYTLFTLPNQMKVMIITSNTTEISAAAISVETGYMQDPRNFQGMSRFLEHMLFLGSTKFP